MKKLTIGILAHVDAGKTTLCEALLYTAGKIRKAGRVDHRDTYLDTHVLERQRGITIFSHQAIFENGNTEFTLLDTPGHTDFSAEMERTLQVLDYAVLVISGTDGVQAHTETLWELLRRYSIPAFIFVTKMDVSVYMRETLMKDLQQHLSPGCLDFSGDAAAREEAAALLDESALENYMANGSLSAGDYASLVRERKLFPCFFGSGLKMEGVEAFLQGLEELTEAPQYPELFSARVYKISRDNRGERLTWLKLLGGELKVRQALRYLPLHAQQPLEEKIAQIRLYSSLKFDTAEAIEPGTVCAVTGLSATYPGQGLGLCADAGAPVLESVLSYRVLLPDGVDCRAVLPKLRELEEEDPLLHVTVQEETGLPELQLMGSVQTEILKEIVRDRFDLDIGFAPPRILYRETIADTVEGVGHFEPLRHYAEVHLILEPGERGSGVTVSLDCPPDTLSMNWQRLILTHLEEKVHRGVLIGAPLTDVHIRVAGGRAHVKHTEGGDFRQATYRAVRQGLMKAQSVLLEPWFAFRLEVPSAQIGRAITDIRNMNGECDAPETTDERSVLTGFAPVAAMNGYAAEVLAYTRGRGHLSCRADGYRPCHNTESVVQEYAYDPEADLLNTPDSVFCAHGAGFTVKWNEVEQYMHVSLAGPEEPESVPAVVRRNLDIDEKELERIMEREFGPVKRPLYRPSPVRSGAEVYIPEPKKRRYIFDGYNVMFADETLKAMAMENLDAARERLTDRLADFCSFRGCEGALIFDAYRVNGGTGSNSERGKLHIYFTREGDSADMYIERLVSEIGKNETVTVVTGDALIRLTALRAGVLRTSSENFLRELESAEEEIHRVISKTQEG